MEKNNNRKDRFSMRMILLFLFLTIGIAHMIMEADAHIPVTYSCCINYTYTDGTQLDNFETITSPGIQLDNFENLNNWTIGGTGASQKADIINFTQGSQSLELIATNGNRAYSDRVINSNFATTKYFSLWIYIYNISTFYYTTIAFTSNNWNTYFFYETDAPSLHNGWNKLVMDKSSFYNINGASWDNTMTKVRITIYPNSGKNTTASFDDFRYSLSNDWLISGMGAVEQADTINFVEGDQSLKLIATNGNRASSDKIINSNFATTNNFVLWLYIYNISTFNYVTIMFTSRDWGTSYFWQQVGAQQNPPNPNILLNLKTGWNKLLFTKKNFGYPNGGNFGNESWNNTMVKIRLQINPTIGQNTSASFDDLRYGISGTRAKIMMTFDDDYLNVTKALPIFSSNHQTAVAFIPTSFVGNVGKMNLTDLRNLQANGWDISSHTVNHPYLTSLNDPNLEMELNGSYDWFVNNNFQKTAGFFAYPFGVFNDNIIKKVSQRYIFGRSIQQQFPFSTQPHFTPTDDNGRYIERVINVFNYTTIQSIKDNIDDSTTSNLLGILIFHDVADSNPSLYQISTTNLQTISDYLNSRTDIDVVTYSDYVIPNINSFTPVINKTTRIYSNGSSVLITKNKYDEYMPNMTVIPSSGPIDINITQYNESTGSIKFNESSPNSDLQVLYNIGDRIPNQLYSVNIYWSNGTIYQNFNVYADNAGYIHYNSTGFQNSRYQGIEAQAVDTSFTVTLPIGYTFLRFNATNSTVNNLNPDGQTSSQPFFNITNNGNINQSYGFYLDATVTNITMYADLNNDSSSGRIPVNNTSTIVIPGLEPGNSKNVWIVVDTNRALAMNINETLTINNSAP